MSDHEWDLPTPAGSGIAARGASGCGLDPGAAELVTLCCKDEEWGSGNTGKNACAGNNTGGRSEENARRGWPAG